MLLPSMPAGMTEMQMQNYMPGMDEGESMPGMDFDGANFSGAGSLSPLPPVLSHGLPAVAFFAFLSFIASVSLLSFLAWRIVTWGRQWALRPHNQFIILIINLIIADILQSFAFLLNVQWVAMDMIDVSSRTCWVQGFFVSTGDLASGVWCLAIGVHTFASVLYDARLSRTAFYSAVFSLWLFVFGAAVVSIAIHPTSLYTRAGAWCWVNDQYTNIRLYAHYMWIFVAELGSILIYSTIFLMLVARIRRGYYIESVARRAKAVAGLMAIYPMTYVVCTLPLASARTAAMAGRDVSLAHLVVSGAMNTSNGWLDVLLYALTRKPLVFGTAPPGEDCGIATLQLPWESAARFGTFTTVAHVQQREKQQSDVDAAEPCIVRRTLAGCGAGGKCLSARWCAKPDSNRSSVSSTNTARAFLALHGGGAGGVRAETTVLVSSAPMEVEDLAAMRAMEEKEADVGARPLEGEEGEIEFQTRPVGF